MADRELSLTAVLRERDEMRKDYDAFSKAYDLIKGRIFESSETQPPRHPLLHTWSGTRACCGSLEMSIHAIERVIEELNETARKINRGEIHNTDEVRPTLTLLKELP